MEKVTSETFKTAFNTARNANANVAVACSKFTDADVARETYYFASVGGFALLDGEITHLFSEKRSQGATLVAAAKLYGGTHLDCFDGYLVKLYTLHGFVESKREANWTKGGPDVVFLALP